MIITIFYSLWVLYTVGSLSIIGLFFAFALYAKWENAKHKKKLDEMFKTKSNLEDEGW